MIYIFLNELSKCCLVDSALILIHECLVLQDVEIRSLS